MSGATFESGQTAVDKTNARISGHWHWLDTPCHTRHRDTTTLYAKQSETPSYTLDAVLTSKEQS